MRRYLSQFAAKSSVTPRWITKGLAHSGVAIAIDLSRYYYIYVRCGVKLKVFDLQIIFVLLKIYLQLFYTFSILFQIENSVMFF